MKILWRQVKPFVRGKIPFAPNTPMVQRIIKQVSSGIQYIVSIHEIQFVLLGLFLLSINTYVYKLELQIYPFLLW